MNIEKSVEGAGMTIKQEGDGKKTILIVEDSDLALIYYETALRSAGYNILSTMDGNKAVEICRSTKVDLVLLDLYLHNSNGFKTVSDIRLFDTKVPVIAQTSYNDEKEKSMSLRSGCNEFITKPLRLNDLLSIVKKYLKED